MPFHRPVAAILAVVSLAAPLAGCGGASSTQSSATSASSPAATPASTTSSATTISRPGAVEIMRKAAETAGRATSLRVVADMTEDGAKIHADMSGRVDGTNQKAIVVTATEDAEVLTVAGKTYMKMRPGKVSAAQKIPPQVLGKYFVVTPDVVKSMEKMSLSEIVKAFSDPGDPGPLAKANTRVEDVTVDGRPAWRLTQRIGGDGTEATIAADGTFQFVSVTSKEGVIGFSQWNAVKPFAAPAAKQIISI